MFRFLPPFTHPTPHKATPRPPPRRTPHHPHSGTKIRGLSIYHHIRERPPTGFNRLLLLLLLCLPRSYLSPHDTHDPSAFCTDISCFSLSLVTSSSWQRMHIASSSRRQSQCGAIGCRLVRLRDRQAPPLSRYACTYGTHSSSRGWLSSTTNAGCLQCLGHGVSRYEAGVSSALYWDFSQIIF